MEKKRWVLGAVAAIAGAALFTFGCDSSSGDMCEPPPAAAVYTAESNNCTIEVGSCPHLGGDEIHNICADALTRNRAWDGHVVTADQIGMIDFSNPPTGRAGQGCDVVLGSRNYDALSLDSQDKNPIVWEIKTDAWSTYPEAAQQCRLKQFAKLYADDCKQVIACNTQYNDPAAKIKYELALSDHPFYSAMLQYLMDHATELELPDPSSPEWQYCEVEDAQSCDHAPAQ